jgi:glutaredoxin
MFVEIYTKSNCSYCVKAKDLLKKQITKSSDIVKEIFIASAQAPELGDLIQRLPNAKTLPQIFIDNVAIGGYDDLVVWFNKTRISPIHTEDTL